jgi:hypothetical protein
VLKVDGNERARGVSHVLWMGGAPCAGKSSMADLLAARYGWRVYRCDDAYQAHTERATPDEQPTLYRAARMSWDEIWMRPVDVQVETEVAVYREQFPMILDDLARLAPGLVIAEGAALLPELVARVLADPRRAVWVVPTADFVWARYRRRGDWVDAILQQCSEPEECFRRWMERDIAYAEHAAAGAAARGWRVMRVDGSRSIEEHAREVAEWFRPTLQASRD